MLTAERHRSPGLNLLHLFSLATAAIAIPLLGLVAKQPELLIVRHAEPVDIVLMALAVVILPPAGLATIETAAYLARRSLGDGLHALWVLVLFWLILLPSLKALPLGWLMAAALALALCLLYLRWDPLYRFVSVAALACLLVPVHFLLFSPVKRIVFRQINANIFPVEVASETPVVWLIFDELPLSTLLTADLSIDAQNFPNFARLSQDSLWFRNATTAADDTMRAVPALLTGRPPLPDAPPLLMNYPQNLFTYLGGSYRLMASENLSALSPQVQTGNVEDPLSVRLEGLAADLAIIYAHILAPPQQAAKLPAVDKGWANFGRAHQRGPREERFESFLQSLGTGGDRALYFLHSSLPHYPYSFLPDGREYDSGGDAAVEGADEGFRLIDEWAARQAYQRHVLQSMFCDRLLGRLLDRLEEQGLYERCLLVVVSDHGASYRGGGLMRPATRANLGDVGPVPLFVKLPDSVRTGIDDRPASTLDLLPTVADVLGTPLPWKVEGRSLLSDAPPAPRHVSSALLGSHEALPYPSSLAPLIDSVKHRTEVFGPQLERLYAIGPLSDLVGDSVPSETRTSSVASSLLWPGLYLDVDKGSRFSPCRIRGQVDVSKPSVLAVAINGVVAGSTWCRPDGTGTAQFSALVNPSFLREGANTVELYLSDPQGSLSRTLLREPVSYRLQGAQLLDAQGRPLPPDPALQGEVVEMILEASGYRLGGWAQPAERVAVFQGERFLVASPLSGSTFRIGLPQPIITEGEPPRVFGISARGYQELDYRKDYRPDVKLH